MADKENESIMIMTTLSESHKRISKCGACAVFLYFVDASVAAQDLLYLQDAIFQAPKLSVL